MNLKLYEFNGEMLSIYEIAKRIGISDRGVYNRIRNNIPLTINGPIKLRNRKKFKNFIEFRGEKIPLRTFCKKYHVSDNTIAKFKKRGGDMNFFFSQLEKRIALEAAGRIEEAKCINFIPGAKERTPRGPKIKRPNGRPRKYEPGKPKPAANASLEELERPEFYDPLFEPIQKIIELYQIKKKTADYVISKNRDKYTIKKIQLKAAAYNFILRTEIEAFVLDCRHEHEAAGEMLRELNRKEREMSLEEKKKAHPLVKDERFFKLDFFPNIDSYFILTECNYKRPEGKK